MERATDPLHDWPSETSTNTLAVGGEGGAGVGGPPTRRVGARGTAKKPQQKQQPEKGGGRRGRGPPPVPAESSAILCMTDEPPHPDARKHPRRDKQPQHVRRAET